MQIAYRFDRETLKKIVKGALIAAGGGAAIGLLNYLGAIHVDNPLLASAVGWAVPTAINIIQEWMSGQK